MIADRYTHDEPVVRFLRAVHRYGVLHGSEDPTDDSFETLTHMQAAELAHLSRPSVASYAKRMSKTILREGSLAVRSSAGFALGVDLATAHAPRVALSNIHGAIYAELPSEEDEERQKLPHSSPAEALDQVEKYIRKLVGDHGVRPRDLIGVGISLPGPIGPDDPDYSAVAAWTRRSPDEYLASAFGWTPEEVPITTANDTYMSALAEHLWGGRSSEHTLFIKWGVTLRAAPLIHGQLYTGFTGNAGELAHTTVDANSDLTCSCNRVGCVHAIASYRTIAEAAGLSVDHRASEIVEVARTMSKGRQALEDGARAIGTAIAPFIDVLNPELVVLGGALGTRAFPLVLDALTVSVEEHRSTNTNRVKFSGARLSRRTGMRGALGMALLRFGPDHLRKLDEREAGPLRSRVRTTRTHARRGNSIGS